MANDTTSSPQISSRKRVSRWDPEELSPAETVQEIAKSLSVLVKSSPNFQPPLPKEAPPAYGGVDIVALAKAQALLQASLLTKNINPVATNVPAFEFAKRLYIGNLYYALNEENIREVFAPLGRVVNVILSTEPGSAERSKGYCFLEYEDALAAESAVQVLDGSTLAKRQIKVGRPFRGKEAVPDIIPGSSLTIGQQAIQEMKTKCIYVAGVRVELNSFHLESVFAPFGEIKCCVMSPGTVLMPSVHREFGFIEFADFAAAESAISHMNGFELAGSKLKVGKACPSVIAVNAPLTNDKIIHDESNSTAGAVTNSALPLPPPAGTAQSSSLEEDVSINAASRQDLMQKLARETNCVMLQNLVNAGEVDDELEEEVSQECSTFGQVLKVKINETPAEVKIFVLFSDVNGSKAAIRGLNGRFFGGNAVKAEFADPSNCT